MSTGSSSTSQITETSTFKGQEQALRSGRLGTARLLLSVLAASAPLMVVAGIMPTVFGLMGIIGQPILYVVLTVVLVLFSIGYTEMSRHVHNAGGFYAYIARGLGPTAGTSAVLRRAGRLQRDAGRHLRHLRLRGVRLLRHLSSTELAWWLPALVAVVAVGVLSWLKIDLNAKVLGALLLIECILVVIFDIAAVANPAKEGLSLQAFNPAPSAAQGSVPRSASVSPPSSASNRRRCTRRRPAARRSW